MDETPRGFLQNLTKPVIGTCRTPKVAPHLSSFDSNDTIMAARGGEPHAVEMITLEEFEARRAAARAAAGGSGDCAPTSKSNDMLTPPSPNSNALGPAAIPVGRPRTSKHIVELFQLVATLKFPAPPEFEFAADGRNGVQSFTARLKLCFPKDVDNLEEEEQQQQLPIKIIQGGERFASKKEAKEAVAEKGVEAINEYVKKLRHSTAADGNDQVTSIDKSLSPPTVSVENFIGKLSGARKFLILHAKLRQADKGYHRILHRTAPTPTSLPVLPNHPAVLRLYRRLAPPAALSNHGASRRYFRADAAIEQPRRTADLRLCTARSRDEEERKSRRRESSARPPPHHGHPGPRNSPSTQACTREIPTRGHHHRRPQPRECREHPTGPVDPPRRGQGPGRRSRGGDGGGGRALAHIPDAHPRQRPDRARPRTEAAARAVEHGVPPEGRTRHSAIQRRRLVPRGAAAQRPARASGPGHGGVWQEECQGGDRAAGCCRAGGADGEALGRLEVIFAPGGASRVLGLSWALGCGEFGFWINLGWGFLMNAHDGDDFYE